MHLPAMNRSPPAPVAVDQVLVHLAGLDLLLAREREALRRQVAHRLVEGGLVGELAAQLLFLAAGACLYT
jgi:hypothetical protein